MTEAARRELFPAGSTRDNFWDDLKRCMLDTYGQNEFPIRLEMRSSGLRQQKNHPIRDFSREVAEVGRRAGKSEIELVARFILGLASQELHREFRVREPATLAKARQLAESVTEIEEGRRIGLIWKCLPKTSLVSTAEKTASGFKSCKEKVTLLCCAIATGGDRLPLLLVGKSKRPRSMIGVQKLPVVYDYQTKAWMTGDIFSRCYDQTFIPYVKEYQQKTKRSGKVLLIIDNAPCHPSSEWLDRENGLFKRYRKQLLRKIVLSEADGGDLVSQLKSISLKDCCYMIAQAWDSISGHTLGVSWKKLLCYNEECVNQSIECDEDFANVTEMFKKFKLSQDEGEQCLADDDTPLFETLTDKEIPNAVKKDENEDVDESDMPDKPTERLSHSEAELTVAKQ
ncbi:Jerky -like protein-like [Trichinella nativa]|uniref:Jerky-like protein-like n=1 Tax=Trichinella nativa TaxID=6335 RepID=A0A0V1KZ16_9BILA|nr:Jerky -like protein-like [Trichinella nativa]